VNVETKKIVAQFAREKKNKLELVMNFPNASVGELKEINLFYSVCKEIIQLNKKGESEENLKKVLTKLKYSEKDLDLILGKKELNYYLKRITSILISLVFVIMILTIFGAMFSNIFSQTEWDFLRKDYEIKGIIFGEDTNFDDLKITSNVVVKNILVSGNEYNATMRCLNKITLNFSKKGFVPLHKTISCEEQTLDLVFLRMNDFKKIELNKENSVEDKGVKIELKGSDLVLKGKNTLAINPSVSVTAFNPNNPSELSYFPGELKGVRRDGNITLFESYGFAKIIIEDENGNSLDFKSGTSAKINFSIDEKQKANAPKEIPLWYFDEIKETWIEEGLAKKVCETNPCVYIGEINKANLFWNASYPVKEISLKFDSFNILSKKLFNESLTELDKYELVVKSPQAFNSFKINFEDLNKEKIVQVVPPVDSIFFAINDIPSNKIDYNSINNSIIIEGFSLENCKLWENDILKFSSCITNFDSFNELSKEKAFSFAKENNFVKKDKSKIFVKIAKHYDYITPCYSALSGDCYLGIACIKMVDEEKLIDSNKNISNILLEKIGVNELSLVLNNLSGYYNDKNYCEFVPIDSQREVCFARFPKEEEVINPIDLCGNGVIEGREKCDGNNFGGLSCGSYGLNRGELACINCQINKSGCYNYYEPTGPPEVESVEPIVNPVCGNNIVEGNEDCDGTNFDELSCLDFGFNSGNLVCENCRVNSSNCTNVIQQTCGNGVIEGSEECEGTNFKGKTCAQYGFNSGNLVCNNCKISTSQCKNEIALPPEIDPLEVFNCPFNTSYASPIKDNYNQAYWAKIIYDSKVFAYKIPYKKSECVGETVLKEDSEGNLIPCITGFINDGCIIEKRELGSINDAMNYYIDIGKHEGVYKQNPVDFVASDGNIFFLIKNEGKEEFIKFSPTNQELIQRIQVYDSNDYNNRIIPSVKRAMASGDVIWVVLNGVLHNVYVDGTGSTLDIGTKCYNAPYEETRYDYGGEAESGLVTEKKLYNFGLVFKTFNYLGDSLSKVHGKVYCTLKTSETPYATGTINEGFMSGFDFDPTKWTYKEEGYGNLIVRTNTNILEYSIDSNNVGKPSFIR